MDLVCPFHQKISHEHTSQPNEKPQLHESQTIITKQLDTELPFEAHIGALHRA